MTNIVVPALGESVSEATIARWIKTAGEAVNQDEPIVELETDKVTLEVNATASGTLSELKAQEGDIVNVGDVIAVIGEAGASAAAPAPAATEAAPTPGPTAPETSAPAPAPTHTDDVKISPAAQKIASEKNIDPHQIQGSGKDHMVTKGDVLSFDSSSSAPAPSAPASKTYSRSKASNNLPSRGPL